jgi:hypothetical protein
VVRDVEQILVGRKRQAVQLFEIIGDNLHIAGGRIEAIDVASADFTLGLDAFIVGKDSIGRVGEPDRPIRLDHHVVGRVQALSL